MCIFCKIVKGEIPSAKIYEDKDILAFLDIAPVNKGHALVIPKEHHETILDVPDDLLQKVIIATKKVSKALMKAANAEGLTVTMNNYKAAGQEVPHAHFHIIPRYSKDGLKLWPQGKYDSNEMEEYKNKILKEIK